jgi:SNF2 family DNA or RNA helicase
MAWKAKEVQYLIQPWDHQLKAIAMAQDQYARRRHVELAEFMEMGTGKTSTAINIYRYLCAVEKRLLRCLILGPVIVVKNWQREFKEHSKIAPADVVPLLGKGAKRHQMFVANACDAKLGTCTRGKVFVTNYEAMEMAELVQAIKTWSPEVLICDESHRLKNPESKRAKTVVQIADLADHKLILTGTPILNTALDIFHQYRILDGGKTFSLTDEAFPGGRRPMNYYEFRASYFEDLNKGMPKDKHFAKWIPRPDTYEVFNKKIYYKAVRVKKSECLDLPPITRQMIEVELAPEQRRLYDEMKNEFITFIKDALTHEPRAVVAQMALTKALRLQQIVSGFVKTEEGKEITLAECPRLDALHELLEDACPQGKVIVWACFHENYSKIAKLCEKLGVEYAEIHGGKSQKEKDEAERRYRSDPDCRVMLANQRAGGIGINLVEDKAIVRSGQGSISVVYSKNFSLEADLQAESRNHRGGAEVYSHITRYDLVARGTIDEIITQALAEKKLIGDQILDSKGISGGDLLQWAESGRL